MRQSPKGGAPAAADPPSSLSFSSPTPTTSGLDQSTTHSHSHRHSSSFSHTPGGAADAVVLPMATPSPPQRPPSPHMLIDMSKLQLHHPHHHTQEELQQQQQQQQKMDTPVTAAETTLASSPSSSRSCLSSNQHHEEDDERRSSSSSGSSRPPGSDKGDRVTRTPILPVRVDLVNLGYKPKPGPKQPLILQDVNACFSPGELVAVMGPSGSGKSTLLRLIQGDHRYLRGVKGEALANGTSIKGIRAWRHLCSLVPQEDVLLGSFTVRETMRFSTQLRFPQDCPVAEQEAVVQEVLEDLGIVECQDVLVKHISGGQRRRVSVGLELLVNPSVLLLDEPTSGLDSKTAEDICGLLKLLTKPGRLVMCSIHQPSFKIFSAFSKLCFLVKGRLAYSDSFARVMPYFAGLGFEVPTYDSPADYYMRVMQTDGGALIEAWAKSMPALEHPPQVVRETGSSSSSMNGSDNGKTHSVAWDPTAKWLCSEDAVNGRRAAQISNWQQYRVLLRRFLEDSYKDKGKMLSGVLMEGTIGLLIGLVWYQQDIHEGGSVFPIMGVFIMLTTIAIFDNCVSVSLKYPLVRALHFREYSNGYYRKSSTHPPTHPPTSSIPCHHVFSFTYSPTHPPKHRPPPLLLRHGHLLPYPRLHLPTPPSPPRLLPGRPGLYVEKVHCLPLCPGPRGQHGRLPRLYCRHLHLGP